MERRRAHRRARPRQQPGRGCRGHPPHPAPIVNAALDEGAHVVGLSILSASRVKLVTEVMDDLRTAGIADVPVMVSGIISLENAAALRQAGVARVYTPRDFDIAAIMGSIEKVAEGLRKEEV